MSLENDVHIYDGTKLDWKKNDNFDDNFCSKILKNLMYVPVKLLDFELGNPYEV